jgi:hypothetical protein
MLATASVSVLPKEAKASTYGDWCQGSGGWVFASDCEYPRGNYVYSNITKVKNNGGSGANFRVCTWTASYSKNCGGWNSLNVGQYITVNPYIRQSVEVWIHNRSWGTQVEITAN